MHKKNSRFYFILFLYSQTAIKKFWYYSYLFTNNYNLNIVIKIQLYCIFVYQACYLQTKNTET